MLTFKVKDDIFETSLEAQEYAQSQVKLPKIQVLGGKARHPKFLALTPYQGDHLDLFQKSSITRNIQCQMEQVTLPEVPSGLEDLSTEDLLTYTLNPGNSNDAQDKRFKKVKVTDRMALEDYRDDLRKTTKVTVTTQPTKHSKAKYSLSPLFVPLFCKKLGVKLDAE